jgi:hypothetical protein
MKLRYRKVTGLGTHSDDMVSGDEDVSVVNTLAVKLATEMQSALDKQEAARREEEFLKARYFSVSNILVPPPHPDVPSEIVSQTQQSAAVQNPLSILMGNVTNNNNCSSHSKGGKVTVTYQQ